ncbi:MAG: glycosyl transferase [Chloroflexaceae bacterium]|nr:glycosyl transferase [Chloroflexaceae bacterium]
MTLSLLCLLVACHCHPRHRLRWLIGAGAMTGLALLTKGPALILLPGGALLMLWSFFAHPTMPMPIQTRLRRAGLAGLGWVGAALAVVVVCWPALWVTPHLALERYVEKILWEGGNAYTSAQFFFGQPVTDPGPLFYPVVLLFRLTPVALVGLLLLPLALRLPSRSGERTHGAMLAAFVLLWLAVMTTGSKKFDRYLLPIWPSLLILAAIGWAAFLRWLVTRGRGWVAVSVLLAGAVIAPVIEYFPSYLSYYNPLAGGGAYAQRVLLVGWGEGTDQVAAYVRNHPACNRGPILATDAQLLRPLVAVPVIEADELDLGKDKDTASCVVFGLPSIQRNVYPDVYAQLQPRVPLHRVTRHGIDYALIYQVPRPWEHPVAAEFGGFLWLHGVTITRQTETLTVTPSWEVRQPPPEDYAVFLHLLNAYGHTVAQVDISPGGGGPPSSRWQPGQQMAVPLPVALPSGLPGGSYRLLMGLYHQRSGERVALTAGTPAPPSWDGTHAVLLDTITLP